MSISTDTYYDILGILQSFVVHSKIVGFSRAARASLFVLINTHTWARRPPLYPLYLFCSSQFRENSRENPVLGKIRESVTASLIVWVLVAL
jgi:hypothetical protein